MQLKGRIGFANLPDQLVNKEIRKGFDFNILCVGKSRLRIVKYLCRLHGRRHFAHVVFINTSLFLGYCRRNRDRKVNADGDIIQSEIRR